MPLRVAQTPDGDLDLAPRNGRGGPHLVGGSESAQAALYNRYSTQQGEWAYDLTYGVPWRSAVLKRYFSEGETAAVLAEIGSRVEGIVPIVASQVSLETEPVSRTALIEIVNVRLEEIDEFSDEPIDIKIVGVI